MATISRMSKRELHQLATENDFGESYEDCTRAELIGFLNNVEGVKNPNLGPKSAGSPPTITANGEKVGSIEIDEPGKYPHLSQLINEVMAKTSRRYGDDHEIDVSEFWEIATLIINACPVPSSVVWNAIVRFVGSVNRRQFNVQTLRSVLAVTRHVPRGYGQAVHVAIMEAVTELRDFEKMREGLFTEALQLKGVEDAGGTEDGDFGESASVDAGDVGGGETDEGAAGDGQEREAGSHDSHGNGD